MKKSDLQSQIVRQLRQELDKRATVEKQYDWTSKARPEQQLPAGDWRIWLILAGRGFGKTRAGAEAIRAWVMSGRCRRLALIGHTEADVEGVMIGGESGLLQCHPPHQRPRFSSLRRRLEWPNGAIATIYSAERYEKLRGPQFDGAWIDELAKYRNPKAVFEQLMFALRLGENPQVIITTTPRPLSFLEGLIKGKEGAVHVTRGSTFDNRKNLSPSFLKHMQDRYESTPLGRQELHGDLLLDQSEALWSWSLIEKCRLLSPAPAYTRIVVALDPAVTSHAKSDETGIIVAGTCEKGHGYVLEDLSGRYTPTSGQKRRLRPFIGMRLTESWQRLIKEGNWWSKWCAVLIQR